MNRIEVWQNGICRSIEVAENQPLSEILSKAGYMVSNPCGGRGVCGKCIVRYYKSASDNTGSEVLACRTFVSGGERIVLPDRAEIEQIETSSVTYNPTGVLRHRDGYGAAVDIGTTTLVLQIYDLSSGKLLSEAVRRNPQISVAADVMSRISAAMNGQGELLMTQIRHAISEMAEEAAANAGLSAADICETVITGNTTMLYLLTGRDPVSLSHAPFTADCLFDENISLIGDHCYLPPCMNAFVGADISCAILSSGLTATEKTTLLCDLGTNGEIALWKNGTLFVTSTAAGPAFEGADISCGCHSISGAIDRVTVKDGEICIHTIGDAEPIGICGSGLIDAVAAGLRLELISETGALEDGVLSLGGGICLVQADIRALQLAKAAVSAGMETLLAVSGTLPEDISEVYIAGGFGSHLGLDSAVEIGLIPSGFSGKIKVVGNAALSGAAELLLGNKSSDSLRRIVSLSKHVNLGGNPLFNERYIENMLFEQE